MESLLRALADEVGRTVAAIPELSVRGAEVGPNAAGTVTVRVDRAAEEAVLAYLEAHDVPLNVLSEEIGYVDRGAEETLILDPIDGTENCIRGLPFFSVSLAVGRRGLSDVHTALVRNLVTGATYVAQRGQGASLDGRRIRTTSFQRGRSFVLVYLSEWADPSTFEFVRKIVRTRSLGCASLELCLVAQGGVDGYLFRSVEYSRRIRVVDIAAGALILREAGGEIYGEDRQPLEMAFTLEERANFLAVGDKKILELVP